VVAADIHHVAIDERNMSAGLVNPETDDADAGADASTDHGNLSLDDLRLRLDSPLFARDHALAAPAQVPRLRELTWEHVVNPTSQHPIVKGDETIEDGAEPTPGAAPKPMRIEDLLAAPADPFGGSSSPSAETPIATASPQPTTDVETEPETDSAPPPARKAAVAPALPSFAAMISSEVTASPEVEYPRERAFADELVKPIEEPPPVARDTDPVIAGLAELIVRSTPVTGMPRVESVRDALRGDTGSVPAVSRLDEPSAEQAAVAAPAGFAPPTPASGVVAMPAELRGDPTPTPAPPLAPPVTGAHPAVPLSAVEAELNRLAYLPDQEEDMGPVEVPAIAYSDVRAAEPVAAAPVLSQAELYTPRSSAAPVRHAYTDLVEKSTPVVPRRRKRHLVRRAVSIVVLLAMVAGGLFAVKYFVLDRVKWPDDVAPLAEEVEAARALQFDHDIPVVTVPAGEYATKLVETTHGITSENAARTEGEWRALGLLTGSLSETAIGAAATPDAPAFYDPATESIYVVDGLEPELHSFAMHRALTMALLDQRFGWGDRIATASPAVARGTRALYDADALAVSISMLTDTERTAVNDQMSAMVTDLQPSPSPFASYSAGRLGLALWPYLDAQGPSQRDLIETDAAVTDAQTLDLRRFISGQPESAGPQAQGMLFWYHVLAARLDDNLAWTAALAWRGDDLSVASAGSADCVTADIRVDAAQAPVAVAVFTAWGAAAPVESNTAVTTVEGVDGAPTQITVKACDPGASVATNDGAVRLSLGGAPLRVEQYRRLLDAQSTLTPRQAACAVYSIDPVTIADERGLVDPVAGWPAPDAHPAPDPVAMGCVSG
jgi:hypothetical protein